MCEFCLKHGEGQMGYLQAKKYSDDLLSDIRRRRFMERFLTDTEKLKKGARQLDRLDNVPRFLRPIIGKLISTRMKKLHYGQVLPIEDVERVFNMVSSVIRVACLCRHVTLGQEKRYCYGVILKPDGGHYRDVIKTLDQNFRTGPDTSNTEELTKAEAIAALRDHEQEGLCHTVWTFGTPFIAGICNCDRSDCLAMRCTVTQAIPVMFRAEYVGAVDPDACTGCRQCMRLCQFGAITYSAANQKAAIDPRRCYGCGICRAVCPQNAIRLHPRATVPIAAKLW